MELSIKQLASAVLANRLESVTETLEGSEINDAFGTETDFADATVDQVAEVMAKMLNIVLYTLDGDNNTERPAAVIKRTWA